jgi:E3 ubiquitin-protein ligase UBR2
MHATCYQKFFDSLVQKERHNAINLMGKILNFDVSIGEFICPICERLSNSVLPLIPSITALRAKQSSAPIPEIGLNAFVTGLASTVESWFLKEDKDEGPSLPRIDVRTTMEEQASLHGREFAQCFQTTQESDCFPLEEGLTSMMNAFSLAAFTTSLELNPFDEDYKVPLVTLQTAALTLTSLERMLWVEERPLLGSLNPREEDLVR